MHKFSHFYLSLHHYLELILNTQTSGIVFDIPVGPQRDGLEHTYVACVPLYYLFIIRV